MLTKIDHLGIAVRSIEQRLGFWRDGLQLQAPHFETVVSERVKVAMLQVGESRIELLEPTEPNSVIAGFIEKRGEGVHHVCFAVPDIEAAVATLTGSGQQMVGEAPRPGAGGCRVAFIHPKSSGGVLIELKEERPAAPTAKAGAPGSIVVLCLRDPLEKYWGRVQELSAIGIQLRGIELSAVESWAREVKAGEGHTMGVGTLFFPLARIERMYLDENVGMARAEQAVFSDIVGRPVEQFL